MPAQAPETALQSLAGPRRSAGPLTRPLARREPPGVVVELVDTPAGVYSVRGGMMRRVPSEAERVARMQLRAVRAKIKADAFGKVVDLLEANKGVTYLLASAAIGAGLGRTLGAVKLKEVTGLTLDVGGGRVVRLGYPVALPDDPAHDHAFGAAQGAGFGAFLGSLFWAVQEAIELRSVSLSGSLV